MAQSSIFPNKKILAIVLYKLTQVLNLTRIYNHIRLSLSNYYTTISNSRQVQLDCCVIL
jgi:hypothetical protein